jgi:hypothetical protein
VDDNPDAVEGRRQELLSGLGLVVDQAALMEYRLRVLFCALMDTPLATVIAARQGARWLINNCRALTDANVITGGLNKAQAQRIREHLDGCEKASIERNALVHGLWQRDGEAFLQAEAKRGSHELTWLPRTPGDMQRVADMLADAGSSVRQAIYSYLGASRDRLESALRELPDLRLDDEAPAD